MTYSISIYRHNEGLVHEISDLPTRYDLARQLEALLARFPVALVFEFSVTATVCKRFTLVDSEITSGPTASEKLWSFMNESLRATAGYDNEG